MNNTAKQYEPKPQPETAQAFADASGIEFSAAFVPQSRSRNRDEKNPSLNWRVTLTKGAQSLTTDYMQGCGHLPGYSFRESRKVDYANAVREACEEGKYFRIPRRFSQRIKPPALVDVLYSLIMDADAINYACFGEWAESYGYDTDSRSAEKIYRQCLELALKLRSMIDLDAAREAFEDF